MRDCNQEMNNNWKGGRNFRKDGYVILSIGENKMRMEHQVMCERVLGKSYPNGVCTHHVNGKRNDNRNDNFVICQNKGYHLLLHKRINALKISGHANWEKCAFCKEYDNPFNLFHSKYGQNYHRKCKRIYQKNNRKRKGETLNACN